jgi:hypothetical protein
MEDQNIARRLFVFAGSKRETDTNIRPEMGHEPSDPVFEQFCQFILF